MTVDGDDAGGSLEVLQDWLDDADGLHVRVRATPRDGELGAATEVLSVAIGSSEFISEFSHVLARTKTETSQRFLEKTNFSCSQA